MSALAGSCLLGYLCGWASASSFVFGVDRGNHPIDRFHWLF